MATSSTAGSFRVMTFNCWGLYLVAKLRKDRLRAIARYIHEHTDYDAIAFQEIWCREDWEFIQKLCVAKMPFGHYFKSSVIGSGCAILSKHPIIEAVQKRYSLNGRPQNLLHGDWLAGKSAGLCRINTQYGLVDLYTTHLIAQYTADKTKDDAYAPHRICQILELMAFIRYTARNHVIVTGDFNLNSYMPGMQIFVSSITGLIDSWESISSVPGWRNIMRARLNELRASQLVIDDILNGVTCDTRSNSFSQHLHRRLKEESRGRNPSFSDLAPSSVEKMVSLVTKGMTQKSQRIDYIFYLPTDHLRCISCNVVMTEQIARLNCSYSDHYGVEAEYSISYPQAISVYGPPGSIGAQHPDSPTELVRAILRVIDQGLQHAARARAAHVFRLVVWIVVWLVCVVLHYIPLNTVVWPYHLTEFLTGTLFWYEVIQIIFVIRIESVSLRSCRDEFTVFLNGTGISEASVI